MDPLLFTTQSSLLTTLGKKPFEIIVGKGENAGNQHFLLFPQCFPPFPNQISFSLLTFILSSANASNSDQSKILSFGKRLTLYHTVQSSLTILKESSIFSVSQNVFSLPKIKFQFLVVFIL